MPFVAYVHADDAEDRHGGRPPWEPNWRMWRWLGLAVLAGYGAAHADGAAGAILVLVIVGLAFRAASEVLPQGDGLREYRQ